MIVYICVFLSTQKFGTSPYRKKSHKAEKSHRMKDVLYVFLTVNRKHLKQPPGIWIKPLMVGNPGVNRVGLRGWCRAMLVYRVYRDDTSSKLTFSDVRWRGVTFFFGGWNPSQWPNILGHAGCCRTIIPFTKWVLYKSRMVGYINTPENSFPAELNWKFGHPPNFQVSAAQLKLAFVDFSGVSTISGGYATMLGGDDSLIGAPSNHGNQVQAIDFNTQCYQVRTPKVEISEWRVDECS